MANRPLIGISGRTKTAGELNMKPDTFRDLHLDVYYCDYALGVIAAGGLPVFLPLSADPAQYGDRLDGLLLSGGTDIEPERYGQAPCPELYTREPDRDAFEMADGYEATGYSDDGAIEVIESRRRPWLGVQWHPELMDSRDRDPVFDWLVQAASG